MSIGTTHHHAGNQSTEHGGDWRLRAACGNHDPNEFDLDVIKDDQTARMAAIRICTRECPVFKQCAEWTEALPASLKPQALIQAGRSWRSRQARTYRSKKT